MAINTIDPALTRPSTSFAPTSLTRGRSRQWARRYAVRVLVTDVLILSAALFGTQALWFGTAGASYPSDAIDGLVVTPWWAASFLAVGWIAVLAARDTWSPRIIGVGTDEYQRVASASLQLLLVVAALAYVLRVEIPPMFLVAAGAAGTVGLIGGRWAWRKWLVRQRAAGHAMSRTLLVGTVESVRELAEKLSSSPQAGYAAVAACIPHSELSSASSIGDVPVVGDLKSVARAAHSANADIVILTSSDHLPSKVVRSISWSLEPWEIEIAVAPAMAEIAGPRIHTRPVAGLPLLHVEAPAYEAGAKVMKAIFDYVMGFLALAAAAPIMAVVAIAVKATSAGPVLYRQERVGLDGRVFDILKFRSMRTGSDAELADLLAQQGSEGTPLFKIQNDPRVTRVGAFIRKYSLDELPQLINVVKGDMSLVGPRPQRPAEVALYDSAAGRRLFVKPGITGLWQVSGRSNLSWDAAVQLDLFYVENWSIASDLALLARTVGVVLRKDGAY